MKPVLNQNTVTTLFSTAIITASTQLIGEESGAIRDLIQMAAPIAAQVIVVSAVWVFVRKGFDTIEGMRESKAAEKVKKAIEQDVKYLESAITSGHLLPDDVDAKKAELSKKYTELTSISARIPKS